MSVPHKSVSHVHNETADARNPELPTDGLVQRRLPDFKELRERVLRLMYGNDPPAVAMDSLDGIAISAARRYIRLKAVTNRVSPRRRSLYPHPGCGNTNEIRR